MNTRSPSDAAPARTSLPEPLTADAASGDRPLVSMLLIAYNQERTVAEAVRGALAQSWQPFELIVSDDCSADDTYAAIEAAVRDYRGPHRVVTRRNERNEGISAHLSRLAGLAQGELLFVAAGDDVSAPERCARVVEYWLAHGRRFDLIATDLADMDDAGVVHERIAPDTLDAYRNFDDWAAKRPYVVGAAHTWSRRLFERFGPMLPGAAAEDQVMTFRAIVSGGASSLHEPLVRYRRGGLSRKRRYRSVAEFIGRQQQSNRYSLAEARQLQHDADIAGLGERMRAALASKLAREQFIEAMFSAPGLGARAALVTRSRGIAAGLKVRMFLYTTCPALYAPLLWAKRTFRK
ncbi:glycosyltransferase family 2 protein [Paraburkholderia caballeronis]|uniref:glycosyltransferase family 2 protein n=1 Tax=Paraburkholderia caballeronis TaxID=416943 RepID=UPI001066960C|nr:glycosyltransferase [Paraburkholderia caballeronis]TDV12152.1 glycosyltransferase involved in cell wall biosynthesis [Paraburkholderia caballeronis]TDV15227.1 glycosyltransferase involved in cell wall biosynthesis [Paraburkholderia caballeronis]TDV24599.1 glycosyltransferase involved in cell wall biosynthesis [Paraburkholderia caballeronis]